MDEAQRLALLTRELAGLAEAVVVGERGVRDGCPLALALLPLAETVLPGAAVCSAMAGAVSPQPIK